LKITYKDGENEIEVQSPNLIVIRLGNTGRKPLLREDFDNKPVTIDFGTNRLMTAEVSDRSSPDIEASVASHGNIPNAVNMQPELLKPGEWLELQCITDGRPDAPEIKVRFAGKAAVLGKSSSENSRSDRIFLGWTLILG
jgi:hypothetical protein